MKRSRSGRKGQHHSESVFCLEIEVFKFGMPNTPFKAKVSMSLIVMGS